MKRVCVITNNYPEPRFITRGAFVENLVREWEEMKLTVDVVAPRSLPNIIRSIGRRKQNVAISGNQVVRPLYITYTFKSLGPVDLKALSRKSFLNAVHRGFDQLPVPDLYYGKFLMSGGMAALLAGLKFNRPAFSDLGESSLLQQMQDKERKLAADVAASLSGIVCVSKRLVEEVLQLGADPRKVLYAPNTVDKRIFFPQNKIKCRKQLGLPENKFIVAFTGNFHERKGPLRVLKAINSLNIPVSGMFFGNGEQVPEGNRVLFANSVPNDKLPVWLNAADAFVLPTLAEGHCNAINEAMACGLPVISSDIPDIRSQISGSTGILVDPMNISEIAFAIDMLFKDRSKLQDFSQRSLAAIKQQASEKRAEKVIKWLENITG